MYRMSIYNHTTDDLGESCHYPHTEFGQTNAGDKY